MVERSAREGGKGGDPVANLLRNPQRNLQRNRAKVGEEEGEEGEVIGEAQEEDLQRNLTVADGDMVVATMEER